MGQIFIPAKGCVYVPVSNGGSGFYALNPSLDGEANAPIIINGTDTADSDSIFPVATLDSKKFVFVMGEDFGNLSITGMVLLGKSDQGGASFRKVVDYFASNRVGVRETPLTLSMPGRTSIKFMLHSLAVAQADPQFNIQYFQLRGIGVTPVSA